MMRVFGTLSTGKGPRGFWVAMTSDIGWIYDNMENGGFARSNVSMYRLRFFLFSARTFWPFWAEMYRLGAFSLSDLWTNRTVPWLCDDCKHLRFIAQAQPNPFLGACQLQLEHTTVPHCQTLVCRCALLRPPSHRCLPASVDGTSKCSSSHPNAMMPGCE